MLLPRWKDPDHHDRTLILLVGWSIAAAFAYKVSTTENVNKIYDPFEILGLGSVRLPTATTTYNLFI